MKKLLPLFILIFAAISFGQAELPEIGSIADIKGKTKFYLASDAFERKWILKETTKYPSLILVKKQTKLILF